MKDKTLKEAVKSLSSVWKHVLEADDLETFREWDKVRLQLTQLVSDERRKLYVKLRNRRSGIKRPVGRPRKYETRAASELAYKKYQHEYYEKVTKQKRRAERRQDGDI